MIDLMELLEEAADVLEVAARDHLTGDKLLSSKIACSRVKEKIQTKLKELIKLHQEADDRKISDKLEETLSYFPPPEDSEAIIEIREVVEVWLNENPL